MIAQVTMISQTFLPPHPFGPIVWQYIMWQQYRTHYKLSPAWAHWTSLATHTAHKPSWCYCLSCCSNNNTWRNSTDFRKQVDIGCWSI